MLKEITRIRLVSAGVVTGGMLAASLLILGTIGLVGFGVSGQMAELETLMDLGNADRGEISGHPDDAESGNAAMEDRADGTPSGGGAGGDGSEPVGGPPQEDEQQMEGAPPPTEQSPSAAAVFTGLIAALAVLYLFVGAVVALVGGFLLGSFLAALHNIVVSITGGLRVETAEIRQSRFRPRGRVAHPRPPVGGRDPSEEAEADGRDPSAELQSETAGR